MKISKAVVAEQKVVCAVSVEDLKAILPVKLRKMIDAGATFEATVDVSGAALPTGPLPVRDGDIVLTVFQRSAPKVSEAGQ